MSTLIFHVGELKFVRQTQNLPGTPPAFIYHERRENSEQEWLFVTHKQAVEYAEKNNLKFVGP